MEWIFHIGIAQSIFAAFLLFTKKGNNLPDKILGTWMVFIFLELAHMLLEIAHSPLHRITSNFGFYSLTFGPFLYLYVCKLTSQDSVFAVRDLVHFVPYVLYSLVHLIFFTNRPLLSGELELDSGWFMLNILRIATLLLSLSIYSILSIRVIGTHKKSIKDSFSSQTSNITLSWLNQVTLVFIVTYLVLIINMLSGNIARTIMSTSHYIPAIGLTFFCFSLSYFGFNQPLLFQKSKIKQDLDDIKTNGDLDSSKRKVYLQKLNNYLETEKPYLNSELNINALADGVKLPRHYLTEILKKDLNKNFFTLINDYRLDEVKRRLLNEKYIDNSVLQLALESGFNSKSSFNAIFKEHTGMTPSEYRKTIN